MRESWCHIEVYVFSQEFLCWNTTRFHPQFKLHSRIRPDFRRKKGFRWNILETVTGQMLGDFCHGWRPCAETVLLDLMPLGHRLYTGLRSGSLCVFYAERLFRVTIFQTETDDSVLFYICTNTLTSSFVQNRKNNSKCVKHKFPCAAWYLLKEPEEIPYLKFKPNHASPLRSLLQSRSWHLKYPTAHITEHAALWTGKALTWA